MSFRFVAMVAVIAAAVTLGIQHYQQMKNG